MLRPDAPDAPVLEAFAPRRVRCDFRVVAIVRVFDEAAIKIHDVKRPIRSGGQIDWMKPRIAGGQKFFVCLGASGDKSYALWLQHTTMYQVQQGFTDKGVAAILVAQRRAAKDGQTRQRVEMLHRFAVERERRWRQGKNAAVIGAWQEVGDRFGGR